MNLLSNITTSFTEACHISYVGLPYRPMSRLRPFLPVLEHVFLLAKLRQLILRLCPQRLEFHFGRLLGSLDRLDFWKELFVLEFRRRQTIFKSLLLLNEFFDLEAWASGFFTILEQIDVQMSTHSLHFNQFLKWAIPCLFFFTFIFSLKLIFTNALYKIAMTGIEPGISGIRAIVLPNVPQPLPFHWNFNSHHWSALLFWNHFSLRC